LSKKNRRLAVAALGLSLGVGGVVPAMAANGSGTLFSNPGGPPTGSLGNVLNGNSGSGLLSGGGGGAGGLLSSLTGGGGGGGPLSIVTGLTSHLPIVNSLPLLGGGSASSSGGGLLSSLTGGGGGGGPLSIVTGLTSHLPIVNSLPLLGGGSASTSGGGLGGLTGGLTGGGGLGGLTGGLTGGGGLGSLLNISNLTGLLAGRL
jgi:hypothetical protein